MPYSTSSIPAALDALVGMCTTAAQTGGVLDGVFISDGPYTSDDALTNRRRLTIGSDPNDPQSVIGDQAFADIGPSRDERFIIVMSAESWSGDPAIKPLRDDAFAIMAAVETLIRRDIGDPKLQGTVMYCGIEGGIGLTQQQTSLGASVAVIFHISCRSRL